MKNCMFTFYVRRFSFGTESFGRNHCCRTCRIWCWIHDCKKVGKIFDKTNNYKGPQLCIRYILYFRQDGDTVCWVKDSNPAHHTEEGARRCDNRPPEYEIPNMCSKPDMGDTSHGDLYTSLQLNEYETLHDEYIHPPATQLQ